MNVFEAKAMAENEVLKMNQQTNLANSLEFIVIDLKSEQCITCDERTAQELHTEHGYNVFKVIYKNYGGRNPQTLEINYPVAVAELYM